MIEYRNSRVRALIQEYIHDERNQRIVEERLCRGYTFDQLAERHHLSVSQIKRIVYKESEKVFRHMT